jgi:hypothetical protein
LLAAERNFAPVNARGAPCAIVEAFWRDPTCFQVDVNQVTSLPPELGLLTNLKELNVRLQADGLQFDPAFKSTATNSRRYQRKSAS